MTAHHHHPLKACTAIHPSSIQRRGKLGDWRGWCAMPRQLRIGAAQLFTKYTGFFHVHNQLSQPCIVGEANIPNSDATGTFLLYLFCYMTHWKSLYTLVHTYVVLRSRVDGLEHLRQARWQAGARPSSRQPRSRMHRSTTAATCRQTRTGQLTWLSGAL